MLTKQSGAVMVISLILLVLLTLVGVTSSQVTGLEEKMAGNMRDRSIAFQAAEAALRDGEQEVNDSINNPDARFCALIGFRADCGDGTADIADDGLCHILGGANPSISGALVNAGIWNDQNKMQIKPSIPYGFFTGKPAIPNVSAQPSYIIEGYRAITDNTYYSYFYRITARAQGLNPNTVIWLQSVFSIPQNNCN